MRFTHPVTCIALNHRLHTARSSDPRPDLGAFEHVSPVSAETFSRASFALIAGEGLYFVRAAGVARSLVYLR